MSKIKAWNDEAIGWALVALGFSIPLSTSGTTLLMGLILLLWIAGGHYREKFLTMRRHPLAIAALILFGLHVLGLLYGKPGERVAFDVLRFLLLVLLIPLFGSDRLRQRALWGFLSAMILLLALSFLAWLHLLPRMMTIAVESGNPLVIQDRITYGFFMTIAAYIWTVQAFYSDSGPKRIALFILAALAVFNLLAMIHNKTTYLILLVLSGCLLTSRWRWKGAAVYVLAIVLLVAVVWHLPATALHQRLVDAAQQFRQWHPDKADFSSVGQRLEFYYNSLRIIRDHPVFGVGVGNFESAYAKQMKDPRMDLSDNPHNEYLLVTVQIGLIGLVALLHLFYTQWRLTPLLPASWETIMARGVVLAFVVGCLFNSLLTDYDEGSFFIWVSALLFSGLNLARTQYRGST